MTVHPDCGRGTHRGGWRGGAHRGGGGGDSPRRLEGGGGLTEEVVAVHPGCGRRLFEYLRYPTPPNETILHVPYVELCKNTELTNVWVACSDRGGGEAGRGGKRGGRRGGRGGDREPGGRQGGRDNRRFNIYITTGAYRPTCPCKRTYIYKYNRPIRYVCTVQIHVCWAYYGHDSLRGRGARERGG